MKTNWLLSFTLFFSITVITLVIFLVGCGTNPEMKNISPNCANLDFNEIIEVNDEDIHCLGWLDSDLGQLLRESNIFNTSNKIDSPHYSLIINNTKCHYVKVGNIIVSQGEALGSCGKLDNSWDSSFENCGNFKYRVLISSSKKQTCLVLNDELILSSFETSDCEWLSKDEILQQFS